jgi:hypothetical protein
MFLPVRNLIWEKGVMSSDPIHKQKKERIKEGRYFYVLSHATPAHLLSHTLHPLQIIIISNIFLGESNATLKLYIKSQ